MRIWLARDNDSELWAYPEQPEYAEDGLGGVFSSEIGMMPLNSDLFSEIDIGSCVEAEIVLKQGNFCIENLEKENFEQSDLIVRLEEENALYKRILDAACRVDFVDPEIVFERDMEGDGLWRVEGFRVKESGIESGLEAFRILTRKKI